MSQSIYHIAPLYLGVEALFYLTFHTYMVPRANELVPPAQYRDYGQDRSRLMERLVKRVEATCAMDGRDASKSVYKSIAEWFEVSKSAYRNKPETLQGVPMLSRTSSTLAENSDDESASSGPPAAYKKNRQDIPASLYQEDVDDFFSWAFFGKYRSALLPWEVDELKKINDLHKNRHGLKFPPKPTPSKFAMSDQEFVATPRRMSLERVNALHRPLLVYIIVGLVKLLGSLALLMMGYQRYVSSSGLVGWYKPARGKKEANFTPLLFFHGIAPCGVTLYLPMIFWGLATEPERPVYLFENKSISCVMDFDVLTEEQTVDGVVEILERTQSLDQPLSLCGHSFGSCPITWLLASKRLPNVQQVVLLDPVTILLSEPDVMVNFLYSHRMNKIRMVAASELFTEYYLRRHFAWYNSELWVEDLNPNLNLLVCLSEQDEIVNAQKVKRELERHASFREVAPKTIFWEGVGHGNCIYTAKKWKQIKGLMLQHELNSEQNVRSR